MCVGDTLNSLRRSFAEGYGGRYALNGVDLKLLPGFFTLCLFLVALLLLLLSLRFALCNLPLEVPNKEAGNGARDAEGEDEGPKGLSDGQGDFHACRHLLALSRAEGLKPTISAIAFRSSMGAL